MPILSLRGKEICWYDLVRKHFSNVQVWNENVFGLSSVHYGNGGHVLFGRPEEGSGRGDGINNVSLYQDEYNSEALIGEYKCQ